MIDSNNVRTSKHLCKIPALYYSCYVSLLSEPSFCWSGKSITFRNVSITFHSCNFCSCLCFILQGCCWISLQWRTHLLHHRWRPLQVHGGLGIIFRLPSAYHFPSYEDIAIQHNLLMCGQRIRHRLKKRTFDFRLRRLLSCQIYCMFPLYSVYIHWKVERSLVFNKNTSISPTSGFGFLEQRHSIPRFCSFSSKEAWKF